MRRMNSAITFYQMLPNITRSCQILYKFTAHVCVTYTNISPLRSFGISDTLIMWLVNLVVIQELKTSCIC